MNDESTRAKTEPVGNRASTRWAWLGGATALLLALSPGRSWWSRAALASIGFALLRRAVRATRPAYEPAEHEPAAQPESDASTVDSAAVSTAEALDAVQEASEESFPASDAPAWNSSTIT